MWADLVQWLLFQFRHPLQSPSWGNGFEVLFGMNIVGLDWDALEIAGMLTNQTNWNCGTKCSVSIKIFGPSALLVFLSLNCPFGSHWWFTGRILPLSVSWVLKFWSPLEFAIMRQFVVECCSCQDLHMCHSKWEKLYMDMKKAWNKFSEAHAFDRQCFQNFESNNIAEELSWQNDCWCELIEWSDIELIFVIHGWVMLAACMWKWLHAVPWPCPNMSCNGQSRTPQPCLPSHPFSEKGAMLQPCHIASTSTAIEPRQSTLTPHRFKLSF